MPSIIRTGNTYHGISVFGRGVFTNDEHDRRTYAGQHRDGYACGLGVLTYRNGTKEYAEHGPDGQYDGRYLRCSANGTTGYYLFERGKRKDSSFVFPDGRCVYDSVVCATDDPRLLALIAQVGPVEVRRAAPAPAPHPPLPCHSPHSPASNRPMCRLGLLQALAKTMATEVRPHATCRRWWLRGTARRQRRCTVRPQTVNRPGWRGGRTGGTTACAHVHAAAVRCTARARPGSLVVMSCPCRA
jgi:hypothetical protein